MTARRLVELNHVVAAGMTTCRHLVADRMDITGARWGLDSAEAVRN
jgi:hypothetical protein